MADPERALDRRLLWASLARRPSAAVLAVSAIAIAVSVASALLHVSSDVGAKLTRELRVLGPNVLLVPEASQVEVPGEGGVGAGGRWLEEADVRRRLSRAAIDGALLLLASVDLEGERVPLVGADVAEVKALHPTWRIEGATTPGAMLGARLVARHPPLGGAPRVLRAIEGGDSLVLGSLAVLTAGGPEDEAVWLPLAEAQRLAGAPGRVSLAQLRLDGDGNAIASTLAALQRGGGVRALPLHALTRTEQDLLARMRRMMVMVTIAALVAGTLSAYGVLTDLALARRREIALLKSLGASRRRIAGRLMAESMVLGALGGVLGWALGFGFAQIIGREVFHAAIGWNAYVPPVVLALALGVAALASAGPLRLVLAIEPARVLKGE